MKSFILAFLFLFVSTEIRSDEIISIVRLGPGQVYSYEDAISLSKETKSKIFVFFGADWCPSCVSMKNGTLKDKKVEEILLKKG